MKVFYRADGHFIRGKFFKEGVNSYQFPAKQLQEDYETLGERIVEIPTAPADADLPTLLRSLGSNHPLDEATRINVNYVVLDQPDGRRSRVFVAEVWGIRDEFFRLQGREAFHKFRCVFDQAASCFFSIMHFDPPSRLSRGSRAATELTVVIVGRHRVGWIAALLFAMRAASGSPPLPLNDSFELPFLGIIRAHSRQEQVAITTPDGKPLALPMKVFYGSDGRFIRGEYFKQGFTNYQFPAKQLQEGYESHAEQILGIPSGSGGAKASRHPPVALPTPTL